MEITNEDLGSQEVPDGMVPVKVGKIGTSIVDAAQISNAIKDHVMHTEMIKVMKDGPGCHLHGCKEPFYKEMDGKKFCKRHAGRYMRVSTDLPVRLENKVHRNAPCPCGSGKKFKHCHIGKTVI